MWLIDSKWRNPLTDTAYKSYIAGSERGKHTRNTMMFNIKIKQIKLLHSYPENQLCKKQMLDVFFHTHTHTRARTHTLTPKFIQNKPVIYSIKWQMYSKTHQTKSEPLQASELKNDDPTSSLPKFASSMRTW